MPKKTIKSPRSLEEKSPQSLTQDNRTLEAMLQVALDLINCHGLGEISDRLLVQSADLMDAPSVRIDLLEGDDVIITYAATPNQSLEGGDR